MPAPSVFGETPVRVLEAALSLIAERGHAGMTMQRVADAAGVDKALLHYYFTNKAGLLAAVANHLGDRLLSDVEQALAGLDEPALVVETGFETMWEHVVAEPELHAAWLSLYAAAITSPELAGPVRAIRMKYRAMVAGRLEAMIAAGWRSRLSAEATVTFVLASIDGFTVALLEGGRSPELDEAIAAAHEVATQLLTRPG